MTARPDLRSARLYLCTDARIERGDFEAFVNAAFAGGVDIIQLRDKTIEAAQELELLEVLARAAERHERLWAVNDRADIAMLSGSPVFHVGQKDLPPGMVRSLLGPAPAVGLSSHTPEQVETAIAEVERGLLDYFCVGPVWATPTKPGRAAVGLDLVRHAASRTAAQKEIPWFAIGGIDHSNIARIVEAGASRVVVVRAITDAVDPAEAATALLNALDAGRRAGVQRKLSAGH